MDLTFRGSSLKAGLFLRLNDCVTRKNDID